MSTEQFRVLSVQERWQATNDLVKEKTAPTGGTGTIGANGRFVFRQTGPILMHRQDFSADIAFNNWEWHPAMIMLRFLLSVFSCGLYSWWWLYKTFKKPPIYHFEVDQYGFWTSTQWEIPKAQIMVRYGLYAWFGFWGLFWTWGVISFIIHGYQ